ncbi:MAG: hypothetical protein WC465_00695 [Patescibacteria group bacterium]
MPKNNEPLVDIRKYCPGIKISLDKYRRKKEKTAYVRLTIAKKVNQAQKLLPKGYHFMIRDAWRSVAVQKKIHQNFIALFKGKYPRWPQTKIVREVNKFVAPWQGKMASGHLTGGAVDIRIVDARGRCLPMNYRQISYHDNASPKSQNLPTYIRKNRELLFRVLSRVDFHNNPREYWHWSWGDYYWAKNKKKKIIYKIIWPEKSR